MPERCLGRIIRRNKEAIGRFGDNSRFYLESRCSYTVTEGEICNRCLSWKENGVNKKDVYGNHFGLVTEPLPRECHIFESEWYTSKVEEYGYPSEFEMARAKQSQKEAREGVEVKEVTNPPVVASVKAKKTTKKKEVVAVAVEAVATVAVVPQEQPKPGKRRPKKTAETVATATAIPEVVPVPVASLEEKPKDEKPKEEKPKAKRQYKKKEAPPATSIPPVVQSKVEVQAIEGKAFDSELEIVKIVVKPFQHNDTSYFRDCIKNKLYSVGKDKRPSVYVGRWDPDAEAINTEFPDSDAE